MMTKSFNASSSAFGWHFQGNAAIMLMIKNIVDAISVKVEGATEDIEITLTDGSIIYSQAKSVFDIHDYSHVNKKLQDALKTLNNAATISKVRKLIYITNSPNPFNNKNTMSLFSGGFTNLNYNELPMLCKKKIEDICKKNKYNFNKDDLFINVLQFYGDDEDNRYKIIKETINEFLYPIGLGDYGLGKKLLEIWQLDFSVNATKQNTHITINKKEMVWPLIVSICNINTEDALLAECDEGLLNEVIQKYEKIMSNKSESFEFITKIISAHSEYGQNLKPNEKTKLFIQNCWREFANDFVFMNIDDEILEIITKVTISNVIKRRININNIKKAVNL
jgi:hypothetical protein